MKWIIILFAIGSLMWAAIWHVWGPVGVLVMFGIGVLLAASAARAVDA